MTYPDMHLTSHLASRGSGDWTRRRASTIGAMLTALALVVIQGEKSALAEGIGASETDVPALSAESWKLAHLRMNRVGADIFTLSHIADFTRSDPRIAGLTIVCNKDGVKTGIVVIDPFPPHSHPRVTVSADDSNLSFDAEVVPPGAQLLFSLDIRQMMLGAWSHSQELNVKITDGDQTLSGVVTLVGIKAGLEALLEDCNRS